MEQFPNSDEKKSDSEKLQEKWWEYHRRCRRKNSEYIDRGIDSSVSQSLSVLNDEEFGPILALADKIDIELANKYDIWGLKATNQIFIMHNDAERATRDKYDKVAKQITDKILSGQHITPEDIKASSFPDFDWSEYTDPRWGSYRGREMTEKEKDLEMAGSVWHSACQYVGNWLEWAMPSVLDVPRDKLEIVIREAMEEFIKKNLKTNK